MIVEIASVVERTCFATPHIGRKPSVGCICRTENASILTRGSISMCGESAFPENTEFRREPAGSLAEIEGWV